MRYECSKCRRTKKASEFHARSSSSPRPRPVDYYCKKCRNEASREWKLRNKEAEATKRKAAWKSMSPREKYFHRLAQANCRGMSEDEFLQMWEDQDGKCLVCFRSMEMSFGKPITFVVDHCHAKGHNRGILCPKCNLGLGHFDDDPSRMRRAAVYIEETQ